MNIRIFWYIVILTSSFSYTYGNTIEAIYQQDHADTTQINTLISKGKALVYEFPDSAQVYFKEAVKISEQLESGTHRAIALNWTGVAHYILGEYNSALPYFTESLHLSENQGDHNGMATSLNHIGLIYQIQGQHERAIEQHKKAIEHAEIIHNTERLASNNFNIGLVYDGLKNYDEALRYVTRALQISEQNKHHRLVSMSYNRLGEIHFHQNKLKEAEGYYKKVLDFKDYQSNWESCFALAGLAQTYRSLKNYEAASRYGEQAYKLARKMRAKWEVIRVADILALTYADKKDYHRAYELQKIARQVSDSVFNEEKERELNFIHLQENELQKIKLQQQSDLQQAELKNKNLYILLSGIVLLSLIIISFILYTRHQQKVKLNNKLSVINNRMEEQNRTLNELNQTKSNLLSIISHDMRSPIVNLGALLQLARENELDLETQKKFMADLQVTVDSLAGSMENLLQWATSQMDGLQTNPVAIDLDDVIETKINLWQTSIQKKNITVHHRKQGLNVYADLNQIRVVMRNIIGNAIKFTHPGGQVSITYRQHANMIGVVVTDTGIGISEEALKELFVFHSGKGRRGTANEKGTGLGLMISNQFVEKNNGKIRVESTLGVGTTFIVWLPVAS